VLSLFERLGGNAPRLLAFLQPSCSGLTAPLEIEQVLDAAPG
jgi:hypothetical protein